MSIKKNLVISLFAATAIGFGALALFTPAQAEVDNTYQYGTFEDLDVDRSGYLENGEYQAYAFGMADWDNDGYLEETEWAKYTELYYDPYELDYDSYSYYDTDGDGFIDRSEFNEITTTELFDVWDYDDDSYVDEGDWDRVTAYYYDAE